MSFIHISEGIEGSCFHFLENGDNQRKEIFLTKSTGKMVSGTLALQVFEDRNYKRITFADRKNAYTAAAKQVLGYVGITQAKNLASLILKGSKIASSNDLCCFDFAPSEISRGEKIIRFEIQKSAPQVSLFGMVAMMCYDFNTYDGCAYLLPSMEVASEWGNALGIHEAYLYDSNDKFDSFVSL